MKKSLLLLSSAVFLVAIAAAPGCSGGGDDDDDDDDGLTVHTGTYAVANATTGGSCVGFLVDSLYADVPESDVTATATTLTIAGFTQTPLTYTITGMVLFDAEGEDEYDLNTSLATNAPPNGFGLSRMYGCTLTIGYDYSGLITGTDEFSLEDTYMISGSGAECALVRTSALGITSSIPCEATDSADFVL